MCSMKLKTFVKIYINFFLAASWILDSLKIVLFNWETQKAKNVQSLITKLNANSLCSVNASEQLKNINR